ncbi:protein of unknown function [Candidatus Hydrogenisulfobacillus filiaventi]|uniref:Uncharacterized protein n=1 Tax=Candidatus Hydrogenisulfobacillus filiaventi TaxID=2707344 RepID=A0A6F8ZF29_9FIRM|nr:protein of unknown function [Candidatus Hydrogenisulfobacillus filiaventi]
MCAGSWAAIRAERVRIEVMTGTGSPGGGLAVRVPDAGWAGDLPAEAAGLAAGAVPQAGSVAVRTVAAPSDAMSGVRAGNLIRCAPFRVGVSHLDMPACGHLTVSRDGILSKRSNPGGPGGPREAGPAAGKRAPKSRAGGR